MITELDLTPSMPKTSLYAPAGEPNPNGAGLRGALGAVGAVGAVVVGGDYQGLGIVRSLGRRGIPVCVIDDEHSIARFSRYTTHFVAAPSLRDELRTVEVVLDTARRLGCVGWVLFTTRD